MSSGPASVARRRAVGDGIEVDDRPRPSGERVHVVAALPLPMPLEQGEIGYARAVDLVLITASMVRGDRLPIAPGELDHANAH